MPIVWEHSGAVLYRIFEFLSAQTFTQPGEMLMCSVIKDSSRETNSPGPEASWSTFVVL